MNRTAYVKVAVTVEVAVGPWDETANVSQICEQAEREAVEKLQIALQRDGGIRVLGATQTVAVMAQRSA